MFKVITTDTTVLYFLNFYDHTSFYWKRKNDNKK